MDRFKMFNAFFIILIVGILATSICSIHLNNKKENVIQRDTIIVNVTDSTLVLQNYSLCHEIDSLQNQLIKVEDELNIAIFKLERIRNYNEIAKNGNNIKYLRGWINRVLDE